MLFEQDERLGISELPTQGLFKNENIVHNLRILKVRSSGLSIMKFLIYIVSSI